MGTHLSMRATFFAFASLIPFLSQAQTITSVYNRDTHEPFHLKKLTVASTVIGPIVRTSTWMVFDNPYRVPTEAALNFDLPIGTALGGFAYRYGKEYVPGRLLDKKVAWSIYTDITSRGRDPGVMDQLSSTAYHCQIFPIKAGQDLEVRVWSISPLLSEGKELRVPKPELAGSMREMVADWQARDALAGTGLVDGASFRAKLSGQVQAVAQRFKDGKTYVCGLMRLPDRAAPKIRVVSAFYEPENRTEGGKDVTSEVANLVQQGNYIVRAENSFFGDPCPNVFKQLRVIYQLDGYFVRKVVPEHEALSFLQGMAKSPVIRGLNQVETIYPDPKTMFFAGWRPSNGAFSATYDGKMIPIRPREIYSGTETARIWAQQRLAAKRIHGNDAKLSFSLKYGVPSSATALLAVPKEEMARYRERQAELRRRALEQQRQKREWAGGAGPGSAPAARDQNWSVSSGGDPEIRVTIPGAKSVTAILPDGRLLALKRDGDVWGGNFEIPANAPEGVYKVRVVAQMLNGMRTTREWTYLVKRTPPPFGDMSVHTEAGFQILSLRSEPGLASADLYDADGKRWRFKETEFVGLYQISVQSTHGPFTIVLKDHAGNKGVKTFSHF